MSLRRRVLDRVRIKLPPTIRVSLPVSPVPHLLSANGIPTEEERKQIREVIAAAEVDEKQLGVDEDVDGANMKKIRSLRTALQDFIRAHQALLVPVRNLPVELLQEIFLFYVGSHKGYHGFEGAREEEGMDRTNNEALMDRYVKLPFLLCQICGSWRRAALHLPALWDRIPPLKLTPKHRKPRYLTFLEMLLRRSGKSETLRICVKAPFKEVPAHPVIAILARHTERIESLTIESGYATVQAFKPMKGKLTNLKRLELLFWTTTVGEGKDVDVFEEAPMLREVVVMGRPPSGLPLPLGQLTHFKERYEGTQLLKLLEIGRDTLLDLEVVKNVHHRVPAIPNPSPLNELRTLRLRLDAGSLDVSERFIQNLLLPAIQDIQIVLGGNAVQLLTTMLHPACQSHTLRRLAFRCSLVPSLGSLRLLFTLIPQLVELDIEALDGDASFLPLLNTRNASSSPPYLLPLLERLYIQMKTVEGHEDALRALVRIRCELKENAMTPLRSTPSNNLSRDFSIITTLRPLRILRVNFPSVSQTHLAQELLNKWKQPRTPEEMRRASKMTVWRRELVESMREAYEDERTDGAGGIFDDPDVLEGEFGGRLRRIKEMRKRMKIKEGRDISLNVGKHKGRSGERDTRKTFPKRWEAIFREMEAFDPGDCVSLRSSRLHHTLYRITLGSRSVYRSEPQGSSGDYIQRAKDLLKGWNRVFGVEVMAFTPIATSSSSSATPPSSTLGETDDYSGEDAEATRQPPQVHLHWGWVTVANQTSVVYLPRNSPLRDFDTTGEESRESLRRLVYGLKDGLRVDEVWWPYYF